jgi:hypothetical protein
MIRIRPALERRPDAVIPQRPRPRCRTAGRGQVPGRPQGSKRCRVKVVDVFLLACVFAALLLVYIYLNPEVWGY